MSGLVRVAMRFLSLMAVVASTCLYPVSLRAYSRPQVPNAILGPAELPLDEDCVANVFNRTVAVNPDGTFVLPDVPAFAAPFRVRFVCQRNGQTLLGYSEFIRAVSGGDTPFGPVTFGEVGPLGLRLAATVGTLTSSGMTSQLTGTCLLLGGGSRDCTSEAMGTGYSSSNLSVCNVSTDGLVTAGNASGSCAISAINEGAVATIRIAVALGDDADGDGLPDEYERANPCLDFLVDDSATDADVDQLTNLSEFQGGSDPCASDTDGNGLTDGLEIGIGTDPVDADSDGDGASDGVEVGFGTNPLLTDTDEDGLTDGADIALFPCTDPFQEDPDGDAKPDPLEDCEIEMASATPRRCCSGPMGAVGTPMKTA